MAVTDMQANDTDRLRALLTTPFHLKLLDAALANLHDTANVLHATNFSNAFRELTRNVLDGLAPEKEIGACPWFVPDKTSKTGFTRRHRAHYVIHGGLAPAFASNMLGIDVNSEAKAMVKAIEKLNKYVHVNEDTLEVDPSEVSSISSDAIAALADVLECAQDCRETLRHMLEGRVHTALLQEAVRETIDDIDIVATHHTIEGVSVEDVQLVSVSGTVVTLAVTGTVDVELQWGSSSDLRRGDGAVMDESFPLACEFTSSVETPDAFELTPGSLQVDNSSWFGMGDDER